MGSRKQWTVCRVIGLLQCSSVASLCEAQAPDRKVENVWNFDKDGVGQSPAGWSFAQTHPSEPKGSWTTAADPAAPSPPNVFAIRTAAEDQTYNLAVLDAASYKDVDLRVKLRADAGKVDQGGGLVWRYKDENNYYICRVNPLESNFRVYKVVDGKRQQLESAKIEAAAGKWYEVRAVMIGNRMACYVDGKRLLAAEDGTLTDAGKIGLWTKADASSSFDDLSISTTPSLTDLAEPRPNEDHD